TRPLRFNKLGISLTHAGVAFFVLSEVITAHFSKETQLQLTVGERSSYSVDPKEMQLVSVEFDHARDTEICCQAVDFSDLEVGKRFQISDQGHTLCVVDFTRRGNVITKHKNTYLTDVSVQKERDENNNRLPLHHVVLFDLYSPANKRMKRMVVEQKKGADLPFFNTHNTSVMFNIVHKREQLEHQFYLNSFTHEVYPKTKIPKHFESELTIYDNDGTFDRKASISMNKPLYLGNKTYYQSGFTSLENKEVSILHVVENPGKSIPYIAAIIVVFGMAFQFLVQLYRYSRRHI
ncbi:cytochrome c biogenesis protein ResB, partial [Chlamydiia bacterium]|nr:cytochrome c biogenesis protein ResB [Chlamydiia bacterium]